MDQFDLQSFIREHPEKVQEIIHDWATFVEEHPNVASFKTDNEFYAWAENQPHIDTTVWVGKVLNDYLQNPPPQRTPSSSVSQAPSFSFEFPREALAFAIIPFNRSNAQIMQGDEKYIDILREKRTEWLKQNNGKDFRSQEGVDYVYGSLDAKMPSRMHQEAEEEFRNKYKEKAERYDQEKATLKKNMHNDHAISRTHFLVGEELQARMGLFHEEIVKDNPKYNKKELEEKSHEHYKQLREQVERKQWTQFIKNHPEKAQAYHKQVQRELQEMQQKNPKLAAKIAPRFTGFLTLMEEEAARKFQIEAGTGTAVTNKSERQDIQQEINKTGRDIKVVDKDHPEHSDTSIREATTRLENIVNEYKNKQPSSGLVDEHGRPISSEEEKKGDQQPSLSSSDIQRIQRLVEESEREIPQSPRGPSEPSSAQPERGRLSRPRLPQRPSRVLSRGGRIGRGLGRAATRAASRVAVRAGQAAVRAGAAALAEVGAPVIAAIILICVLFLIIILILPGPSEKKTPTAPGFPIATEITSCQFYRAGEAATYKSSLLLSYFQDVSRVSGIPASILAGFARVESPGIVNVLDEGIGQYSCAESSTGALGLMQLQPPAWINPKEPSVGAYYADGISLGAQFLRKNSVNELTREDFCDVKSNITLAAGFIIKRTGAWVGESNSTSWNPAWTTDRNVINKAASGYYGCLQYPSCSTGPYSYGDDLWTSVSNCQAQQTPGVSGEPIVIPEPSTDVAELREQIRSTFGIVFVNHSLFDYEILQWTWDALWKAKTTAPNFFQLLGGTVTIGVTSDVSYRSGNNIYFTTRGGGAVGAKQKPLFQQVLLHELGHVIRKDGSQFDNLLRRAQQADGGYLTSYGDTGCYDTYPVDEDFSESVSYYILKDIPEQNTTRCAGPKWGTNPFSTGNYPNHLEFMKQILGSNE